MVVSGKIVGMEVRGHAHCARFSFGNQRSLPSLQTFAHAPQKWEEAINCLVFGTGKWGGMSFLRNAHFRNALGSRGSFDCFFAGPLNSHRRRGAASVRSRRW